MSFSTLSYIISEQFSHYYNALYDFTDIPNDLCKLISSFSLNNLNPLTSSVQQTICHIDQIDSSDIITDPKLTSICCMPNNNVVVGGLSRVKIFDIETGECTCILRHQANVLIVNYFPCNEIITACSDHSINRWDINKKIILNTLVSESSVQRLKVLPNCQIITSSYLHGQPVIQLWDIIHQLALRKFKGHKEGISCFADIPNNYGGVLFASGSHDGEIRIWESSFTHIDQPCIEILHGHSSSIVGLEYCMGSNVLVSGSSDWSIKIWQQTNVYHSWSLPNIGKWRCLKTIQRRGSIRCLTVLNNRCIAFFCGNWNVLMNRVEILDIVTGEVIRSLVDICDHILTLPNDWLVCASGRSTVIRLWGNPFHNQYISN